MLNPFALSINPLRESSLFAQDAFDRVKAEIPF